MARQASSMVGVAVQDGDLAPFGDYLQVGDIGALLLVHHDALDFLGKGLALLDLVEIDDHAPESAVLHVHLLAGDLALAAGVMVLGNDVFDGGGRVTLEAHSTGVRPLNSSCKYHEYNLNLMYSRRKSRRAVSRRRVMREMRPSIRKTRDVLVSNFQKYRKRLLLVFLICFRRFAMRKKCMDKWRI